MPDLSQLSQETLDQLPPDFEVQIAHLNDAEQAQVIEAVHDAADAGDLQSLDLDHTMLEAEVAQEHKDTVAELHQEQADAVASGDYAKADDLAHDAAWEVQAVQDHGGEADAQLVTAQHDEAHLDTAAWEQATAHEQADWSASLAASGDAAHADAIADTAATHADAASSAASAGDQGGHYADHSYDSAAATSE